MQNEAIHKKLATGVPPQFLQERTLDDVFHLALIEDTGRVTHEVEDWITSQ